jgi:Fe-S oxidoreductase
VAAVDALEAAGYRVTVPRRNLCCGRPLYDFGMLDLAQTYLRQIMENLDSEIRDCTPIVVLEPACASVFKDELLNLFPGDDRARRLSRQVQLFGDFVAAAPWNPPGLGARAILQAHCHHSSVFGLGGDLALLKKLGVECETPEPGCCGMAGSFGFNPRHYELSMKLAERALLPAVRSAAPDTLVIANGYSCREQIAQGTSRRALHLAEVVRLAVAP